MVEQTQTENQAPQKPRREEDEDSFSSAEAFMDEVDRKFGSWDDE